MTSQLNVDTIVDKAGSGGTNVKIANTSVTVSEGGSATTTTVQGLLKNWCKFDGTGTVAIDDSFNTTSLTDNSAGNYTITIANDMGSVNYSVSGSNVGSGGYFNAMFQSGGTAHTATAYRFINRHETVGDVDVDSMQTMVAGDLA